MIKNVLFVILNDFADWEAAPLAAAINQKDGWQVQTVSLTKAPIRSMGGFTDVYKRQLVLAVPAVIAWLVTCALLTWASFAYDGALSGNPIYFWVYGGAILFAGAFTENYAGRRSTDRSPRWAGALVLLLCTALAYLLIDRYDTHLLQSLLYDLLFWWLVLLLLVWLCISAYQHSRFRRPMKPRRQHTSFYNACAFPVSYTHLPEQ